MTSSRDSDRHVGGLVELRQAGEIQLECDFLQQIGRGDHLDLAGHALLVEQRAVGLAARLRPGEDRLAFLNENARLAPVVRRREPGERQRERSDRQRDEQYALPAAGEAAEKPAEVDVDVAGR